jgi:glycosyltransferase involved in cell wall biosynthesis
LQRIKIAFFAEILIEEFDGASRTMFQILKRIPKSDFEFLFFCGTGPNELFGYQCIKVPAITIPFNSTYKMAIPALAKGKLAAKLEEFQPDIVHIATPSSLGSFALNWAHQKGLPIMTIYHTHFISYVDYYFKVLPFLIAPVKRWVAGFQKRFYNSCHLIYVPSESIAAELVQGGVEQQRISIWKRGIDAQLFHPDKRDIAHIQSLTKQKERVILFASRLVWEKNLQVLIDLYQLIVQRNLPWHILVAGDGVAADSCKRQMSRATFLGTVSHTELSMLYASSDVFFFPSISESYGNVVLEAMASGLPCVIADGGGSRDFIEQGVNGFTCAPYDAAGYLTKIEHILNHPELWQEMHHHTRAYAVKFDWESLVERYFTDIKALVSKSKDTTCAT